MPNWVRNTLQITGAPEVVSECLASMGSPERESEDDRLLDFERVVSLPPDLRARLEVSSSTEEEAWDRRSEVIGQWGTKWSAFQVTVERQPDGGGAIIKFDTAWTPPMPVISTLADRFPSLEFDFTYLDIQAPIAGRARRAPGGGWATIDARFDDGFCDAALDAKSGRWDLSSEAD